MGRILSLFLSLSLSLSLSLFFFFFFFFLFLPACSVVCCFAIAFSYQEHATFLCLFLPLLFLKVISCCCFFSQCPLLLSSSLGFFPFCVYECLFLVFFCFFFTLYNFCSVSQSFSPLLLCFIEFFSRLPCFFCALLRVFFSEKVCSLFCLEKRVDIYITCIHNCFVFFLSLFSLSILYITHTDTDQYLRTYHLSSYHHHPLFLFPLRSTVLLFHNATRSLSLLA